MNFTEQIIPAVVILVANVFSGPHGSHRWETVTACFGWCCIVSFLGAIAFYLLGLHQIGVLAGQLSAFSMITALSRDYERIFKPIVDRRLK